MSIERADSLGIRYQGLITANNTPVTLLTVPAGKTYSAIKATFGNNDDTDGVLVSVFLCPSGGDTTNLAYREQPPSLVPAGLVGLYKAEHEITEGFTVRAIITGIATSVSVIVSARELS